MVVDRRSVVWCGEEGAVARKAEGQFLFSWGGLAVGAFEGVGTESSLQLAG